jgi:hypothetical protein
MSSHCGKSNCISRSESIYRISETIRMMVSVGLGWIALPATMIDAKPVKTHRWGGDWVISCTASARYPMQR